VKAITRLGPGNHEYLTSGGTNCNSANAGAAGYVPLLVQLPAPSRRNWSSAWPLEA
jgi:hypothetical protein